VNVRPKASWMPSVALNDVSQRHVDGQSGVVQDDGGELRKVPGPELQPWLARIQVASEGQIGPSPSASEAYS